MHFIDPFNSWSLVHFTGSLLLTMTIGSLNIQISPFVSGGMVLGSGLGWELVADGRFRNDPRGGDYYDLMWDLGGTLLGSAILQTTHHYRRTHQLSPTDIQFHPMMPSSASGSQWWGWYTPKKARLNLPPTFLLRSDSLTARSTVLARSNP
jgi:hypothetical protein